MNEIMKDNIQCRRVVWLYKCSISTLRELPICCLLPLLPYAASCCNVFTYDIVVGIHKFIKAAAFYFFFVIVVTILLSFTCCWVSVCLSVWMNDTVLMVWLRICTRLNFISFYVDFVFDFILVFVVIFFMIFNTFVFFLFSFFFFFTSN